MADAAFQGEGFEFHVVIGRDGRGEGGVEAEADIALERVAAVGEVVPGRADTQVHRVAKVPAIAGVEVDLVGIGDAVPAQARGRPDTGGEVADGDFHARLHGL